MKNFDRVNESSAASLKKIDVIYTVVGLLSKHEKKPGKAKTNITLVYV